MSMLFRSIAFVAHIGNLLWNPGRKPEMRSDGMAAQPGKAGRPPSQAETEICLHFGMSARGSDAAEIALS